MANGVAHFLLAGDNHYALNLVFDSHIIGVILRWRCVGALKLSRHICRNLRASPVLERYQLPVVNLAPQYVYLAINPVGQLTKLVVLIAKDLAKYSLTFVAIITALELLAVLHI